MQISQVAAPRFHTKPISPEIVAVGLRIFDPLVIGIGGSIVYFLNIFIRQAGANWQYFPSVLVGVLLSVIIFHMFGVYSGDFIFSKRLRLDRVLLAWVVTFAVMLTIAFAFKITGFYSRIWAVGWFTVTGAALVVTRLAISDWVLQMAREGRFALRTVILGAGEQGQRLAAHLSQIDDVRIHVLGFVDDRASRISLTNSRYRLLGNTDHLLKLIRQGMVDQVFLAFPWTAQERLRELSYRLAVTPIPIHLAPDLVGFEFADRPFTQIGQLPMLHLFDRPISGRALVLKTLEDWIFGSLLLIFVAPLMLIIALAIKIDSPGPVFFTQRRYGFNDNLFPVMKFRTMYSSLTDQECQTQTTKDDPRITRIGRFLRKSSLDELPQLFNVLSGHMSLVGPRPHAIATKADGHLFADVVDQYAARHRVKPGLTGWAQVNGLRGETDSIEKIRKRVEYDLYYIDNWSLWFDLIIILRTLVVLFKDENAY